MKKTGRRRTENRGRSALQKAIAERNQLRTEVERLTSLVKDPLAMHVNILRHMPGYRLMPDEYLVRLNSQIAANDEALKVAKEAIEYATTFIGWHDGDCVKVDAALRRIEGLKAYRLPL